PQINFLDARIVMQNEKAYLSYADVLIPLSDERKQILLDRNLRDQEVVMGIRPEHISYEEDAIMKFGTPTIEAKAEVTEIMGAESYLYFTISNDEVTVRVNGNTKIRPGDLVRIAFNSERIHVFDKDTEETLF
ncbi:MAG TPA: TOBE domain-containing protein, partial [Bacteroidales bacterium]|nr:TOBE domain-containing protein [Bacteroidales bacterium]